MAARCLMHRELPLPDARPLVANSCLARSAAQTFPLPASVPEFLLARKMAPTGAGPERLDAQPEPQDVLESGRARSKAAHSAQVSPPRVA
jgi:hypothetical protein